MTNNWYLILELEFEPNPVIEEAIIRQQVKDKKKFWSSRANDFTYGAQYKSNMDLCKNEDAIVRDIQDEGIRAEMIKDAFEKLYVPIDKTLKSITKAKSEIPEDTVEKIAKQRKVDIQIVKKRMAALGIKVGQSQGGDYQATYEKYYKTKPQNADKYNVMVALFAPFHVDNLYEFLALGTTQKNLQKLPSDKLRQLAKEKKAKEFYKNDAVSGSGSKLCGQCEECFKDESTKQIYDRYLEYIKRKAVLDDLKNVFELVAEITPDVYEEKVGLLTEIFKSRKDAENLIIAFCKVEKIPIAASNAGATAKNPHIKICRCGCTNDVSDGRKVCKVCGLELEIKCPKCGEINEATIKVCKCGFKFENIDKAFALCDLAEMALDTMDFAVAEVHLSDADRYWPGSERVASVKSRLSDLKKRVGTAVVDMKEACKSKNYYEARRQYESIKKFSQGYSDAAIEEEIDHAIREAEKYKKIAQTSKSETEIVEACTNAYEKCNDCPGVKEIIAKYPPVSPSNLVISIDSKTKVNVLSWTKSSTQGLLYYNIVRKEGAVPISVQDGVFVGRVSMCSINDNNVVPGAQYYYAVFAERAGVYSESLVSKEPVCNLFEITGVKVAAGDKVLQITWNQIAENATVMIDRTDNAGKKSKIECNNRSTYVDKDLSNDSEYHYKVFLQYAIGVKKVCTEGIHISGTPTRPPLPIDRLLVKPGVGNEFNVEWENPEGQEVQFFYSETKPNYLRGDLVAISTLESSMNSLVVNKTSNTSGTFKYEKEDLIYVLAVVVRSGSAVIGTISRASKGGTVKVNNANLVNGKIMINVDLPNNATGFVVLYRFDQFPEDISDVKTRRKYIPLKQYQYDGGLVIDSNEQQNYYFTIFAEFRQDGESDYSIGTDYLFSNVSKETITYSISVNKKLFGQSTITMNFECENKKFLLPAIDIMSAVDRAPMFKKSGKLFYQISAQEANGTVEVKIPLEKGIARDTYIKPYLQDESLTERYVLKIKLGSEHKIS